MRRARSSLRQPVVIFWTLLLASLAATVNAGYWEATYDLAPSSNLNTVTPGGTFNDPITGTVVIRYDAASSGAPLDGARLVVGQIDNTVSQPAGVLTVTGSIMNALTPGLGGTPGTLAGAVLNLAVVANHTVSGFLHCSDATGPGGFCSIFFGTPASNTLPQTGTGTFAMPNLNFATTAGVGDFTSDASVQMPQAGVTTTTVYVGQEVSRVWVPVVPSMGPAGMSALFAGLVACGFAVRRRR